MTARILRSTWAIPVAIAIASVAGLIGALTGDGVRDVLAWIALALAPGAAAWAIGSRRTC
ncbi:hypothetical protein [Sphingomonas sp. 1P08PE]|uniref:hypothetical protein n=1 Tax=Sphingomonas sp. 1P08PE TaxID=554122 RepID=UPI0039A11478